MELIKREDFLNIIEEHTSLMISNEQIISSLSNLLQIDPKYNDIF
jgi:hypothetical protein